MKKKVCMYPLCSNFDPKAGIYCCNGCANDHYDYARLHEENKDNKDTTLFGIVGCLKAAEKIIPPNLEVKDMWFRALSSMRAAVQIQKTNDLNTMTACLKIAEEIVPLDLGIKKVWSKSLALMREAVELQSKDDKDE